MLNLQVLNEWSLSMNNKNIKLFMCMVLMTVLPTQCEGWREWFGKIFKCSSCDGSQQYGWQKWGAAAALTVAGVGLVTYLLKYRSPKTKFDASGGEPLEREIVAATYEHLPLKNLYELQKRYKQNILADELAGNTKELVQDKLALDAINLQIELKAKK